MSYGNLDQVLKFAPEEEIKRALEAHKRRTPEGRRRFRRAEISHDTLYYVSGQLDELEEIKSTISAMSCGGIMSPDEGRGCDTEVVLRAQLLDEVAATYVKNLENVNEQLLAVNAELEKQLAEATAKK